MSSFTRKIKKKTFLNLRMSMKFECPCCNSQKEIPREVIDSLDKATFKDNPIFKCHKCKVRMNPITIEVDY